MAPTRRVVAGIVTHPSVSQICAGFRGVSQDRRYSDNPTDQSKAVHNCHSPKMKRVPVRVLETALCGQRLSHENGMGVVRTRSRPVKLSTICCTTASKESGHPISKQSSPVVPIFTSSWVLGDLPFLQRSDIGSLLNVLSKAFRGTTMTYQIKGNFQGKIIRNSTLVANLGLDRLLLPSPSPPNHNISKEKRKRERIQQAVRFRRHVARHKVHFTPLGEHQPIFFLKSDHRRE